MGIKTYQPARAEDRDGVVANNFAQLSGSEAPERRDFIEGQVTRANGHAEAPRRCSRDPGAAQSPRSGLETQMGIPTLLFKVRL